MPPDLAGRATYATLDLPLVALHEARAFIGLEEEGDNRGPAVEFFQMHGEIDPGQAWCAAFVNGCVHTACAKQNVQSPLEEVALEGFVQSYIDWAEAKGAIIDPPGVQPGDLFALYHAGFERFAHIGFVFDPPRDTARYSTIEGNAGDEGEREGYKVTSRIRRLTDGTAFIRWTDR